MNFSVTQFGKKLSKDKYTWNEDTRTFSTVEDNLVLDFIEYNDCTFKTGWNCTFKTGFDCTFDTGDSCTFKTGSGCTFDTGDDCVIVRRDVFEVIQPEVGTIYKLCPYNIKGYLTKKEGENAFYMDIDCKRVEHIIADGILSKVVKKKGNVYHVINHGRNKETFLVKDGELYSHGDTLKDARESLKYKIADRNTTEFEKYKLDDEGDWTTLIRAYRAITGACEAGTKYFCENNTLPEKMTVAKAIELIKNGNIEEVLSGQFTSEKLQNLEEKLSSLKTAASEIFLNEEIFSEVMAGIESDVKEEITSLSVAVSTSASALPDSVPPYQP